MGNSNLRLDIQGLRALAVLSVVIFHISPDHITGGYLGVDVFFVISGYLIMGQIWRALNESRLSFTEFYTKRFQRLLPALVTVLIISTLAAYYLLLPGEYRDYTYSVFSSLFYFSNFWFYTKSGYFDAELQTSPLLHTWSLSVEEQFYFIFPFLLVFLYKACSTTKKALGALVIIAIVTLLLSEWLLSYDQSLSFYASPTRFWQFIVGGLLAISKINAPKQGLSQLLSLIGLAILVFVIFTFDEKTPFPGFMAIPVTLATALVIYARAERGIMGWVLSNPVSNFFGNISYSFYLWHWPVIIFYKIYLFDEFIEFEKVEKLIALIISIVLASVTYWFIEIPFKNRKLTPSSFKPILISMTVTLGLAFTVVGSSYFQRTHFTQQTIQYESYLAYKNPERQTDCFLTSLRNNFDLFNKEKCITAKPGKFNILLLGDSHAEHWFTAIKQNLQENQTLSMVTASGCRPLLPLQGIKRCTDLMDWAINDVIANTKIDKIIISGRWIERDIQYLASTITLLKKHTDHVLVAGPVIEYEYPLPMLLAKFGDSPKVMQFTDYAKRKHLDLELARATSMAGGEYQSTIDYMCSSELKCQRTTSEGVPMQFDYGHLTHEGAVTIMDKYISEK
ncbi:MAG: acyltransferase family protein [Paraglaciecola sp.]|uniref:acyltransferase family protein n=1 Tax=Paraglaciecola sp. TaxID=1920173 RepID=UPI00329746B6